MAGLLGGRDIPSDNQNESEGSDNSVRSSFSSEALSLQQQKLLAANTDSSSPNNDQSGSLQYANGTGATWSTDANGQTTLHVTPPPGSAFQPYLWTGGQIQYDSATNSMSYTIPSVGEGDFTQKINIDSSGNLTEDNTSDRMPFTWQYPNGTNIYGSTDANGRSTLNVILPDGTQQSYNGDQLKFDTTTHSLSYKLSNEQVLNIDSAGNINQAYIGDAATIPPNNDQSGSQQYTNGTSASWSTDANGQIILDVKYPPNSALGISQEFIGDKLSFDPKTNSITLTKLASPDAGGLPVVTTIDSSGNVSPFDTIGVNYQSIKSQRMSAD